MPQAKKSPPDTLPADFFSAPDTLPKEFFDQPSGDPFANYKPMTAGETLSAVGQHFKDFALSPITGLLNIPEAISNWMQGPPPGTEALNAIHQAQEFRRKGIIPTQVPRTPELFAENPLQDAENGILAAGLSTIPKGAGAVAKRTLKGAARGALEGPGVLRPAIKGAIRGYQEVPMVPGESISFATKVPTKAAAEVLPGPKTGSAGSSTPPAPKGGAPASGKYSSGLSPDAAPLNPSDMHEYMMAQGRIAKAADLTAQLQAEGVRTLAQLKKLTPAERSALASRAKVRLPSQVVWDLVEKGF